MQAYPVWAYYAHGRQRRCQGDPVSLPSGRLEKTTTSSPHHVAQHRPTGSETTPPYAPRSSRFGSEPPSMEDDVDVWCYAIVRVACQKRRRCNKLSVISVLSVNAKLFLAFYRWITSAVDRQHLELVDHADDELFENVLGIGQPRPRSLQCSAQRNSVNLWTAAYATQYK